MLLYRTKIFWIGIDEGEIDIDAINTGIECLCIELKYFGSVSMKTISVSMLLIPVLNVFVSK